MNTTSDNRKSQRGFDEYYRPIRNKLRKFDKTKLLYKLIEELHKVEKKHSNFDPNTSNIYPYSQFPPWCALLAIRWLLVDWDCQNNSKKEPTVANVKNIVNSIMQFTSIEEQSSEYNFFRGLTMQQFHYNQCNSIRLGRTYKLFSHIKIKPKIESIFQEHKGMDLSLDTYFKMAFCTYAYYCSNRTTIGELMMNRDTFKPIGISEADTGKFFGLTSLTIKDAIEYCRKQKTKDDYIRQYFELSPLRFYPFLNIERKEWIAWSPTLIQEYLVHGIYDFCKEKEKGSFCEKFGKVFEKYLAESMKNSGIKSFITEDEQKLKGLKNQVDFVVQGNKGNILIEAKAVEAKSVTGQMPTIECMHTAYKSNVVKAVEQGFYVASKSKQDKLSSIASGNKNYLLIVTYKELFLGSSHVAWNDFISKSLEKFFRSNSDVSKDTIDVKNIYFLSVDDFDRLMSLGCIDKIIEKLDTVAEKYGTKEDNFCFGQHLGDLKQLTGQLKLLKKLYTTEVIEPLKYHLKNVDGTNKR